MLTKFVKFIPNLFTLGNLFLGCLGIVFCFNDHIFPVQANELDATGKNIAVVFGFNNRLYLASFMIYAAAILDFLDGFVARWLKATSPLGAQLDSLADGVTFSLLPACIYFQLLSAAYHLDPQALEVPIIFVVPAFLIALCGAYRLAKFNVDERQQAAVAADDREHPPARERNEVARCRIVRAVEQPVSQHDRFDCAAPRSVERL